MQNIEIHPLVLEVFGELRELVEELGRRLRYQPDHEALKEIAHLLRTCISSPCEHALRRGYLSPPRSQSPTTPQLLTTVHSTPAPGESAPTPVQSGPIPSQPSSSIPASSPSPSASLFSTPAPGESAPTPVQSGPIPSQPSSTPTSSPSPSATLGRPALPTEKTPAQSAISARSKAIPAQLSTASSSPQTWFKNFIFKKENLSTHQVEKLVGLTSDWDLNDDLLKERDTLVSGWIEDPSTFWDSPPNTDSADATYVVSKCDKLLNPNKKLLKLQARVLREVVCLCTYAEEVSYQESQPVESKKKPSQGAQNGRDALATAAWQRASSVVEEKKKYRRRIKDHSSRGFQWLRLGPGRSLGLGTVGYEFEAAGLCAIEHHALVHYSSTLRIFQNNLLEDAWNAVVENFTPGYYAKIMDPAVWKLVKEMAEGPDDIPTQSLEPETGVKMPVIVNDPGGSNLQDGGDAPPTKRLRRMRTLDAERATAARIGSLRTQWYPPGIREGVAMAEYTQHCNSAPWPDPSMIHSEREGQGASAPRMSQETQGRYGTTSYNTQSLTSNSIRPMGISVTQSQLYIASDVAQEAAGSPSHDLQASEVPAAGSLDQETTSRNTTSNQDYPSLPSVSSHGTSRVDTTTTLKNLSNKGGCGLDLEDFHRIDRQLSDMSQQSNMPMDPGLQGYDMFQYTNMPMDPGLQGYDMLQYTNMPMDPDLYDMLQYTNMPMDPSMQRFDMFQHTNMPMDPGMQQMDLDQPANTLWSSLGFVQQPAQQSY